MMTVLAFQDDFNVTLTAVVLRFLTIAVVGLGIIALPVWLTRRR